MAPSRSLPRVPSKPPFISCSRGEPSALHRQCTRGHSTLFTTSEPQQARTRFVAQVSVRWHAATAPTERQALHTRASRKGRARLKEDVMDWICTLEILSVNNGWSPIVCWTPSARRTAVSSSRCCGFTSNCLLMTAPPRRNGTRRRMALSALAANLSCTGTRLSHVDRACAQ
jgi:hypothetical protein